MRFLISLLVLFTLYLPVALAQDAPPDPAVPPAVSALLKENSTAVYLGEQFGYESWILAGPAQKQVVYVQDGGQIALSGTMTDENGTNLSALQLIEAAKSGKLENLTEMTEVSAPNQPANQGLGDRFLSEIAQLRGVSVGPKDGKTIYVFMDPNCPYCHEFDQNVRAQIAAGKSVQMQVMPAPILGSDSRDKVLRIYSAGSPSQAWDQYMADGKLPEAVTDAAVKADAEQSIQANLNSMIRWNLNVVPFIAWRNADGRVMINYGTPKDMREFWHSVGLE